MSIVYSYHDIINTGSASYSGVRQGRESRVGYGEVRTG